jgi:hypothetical protein
MYTWRETIDLTETEVRTLWNLGADFYLYDHVEIQGRRFSMTCDGPPPRSIITARAISPPGRWTVALLTRYETDHFPANFSGDREMFHRDLFMLKMVHG